MITFIRPCEKYLGFDDRRLMLIGIPLLSLLMPILLDLSDLNAEFGYWSHQVPESLIIVTGFWLSFRAAIIWLRKKFQNPGEAKKRISVQVLFIIASAPILKNVLAWASTMFLLFCSIDQHAMPNVLTMMVNIYLPSFLIIAVYEAVYYFQQYKKAIVDRERLENQHLQTELSNLRNQINPHFLFNSLNTLMNLIPTNQDKAMSYLSKLSKFYRYAVGVKEEKLIPLSKEIEFANLYVDLLNVRFADALDVSIDIDSHSGQMIPPLSLQLLIENAVKHNVVSRESPLRVSITFDRDEGELVVVNNLQKKMDSVASSGMGLVNIKKRFQYFTQRPVKVIQDLNYFQVTLPTVTH